MSVSFKVKITDKGTKRTVEQIFGKRDSAVKVGVLGDKGEMKEGDSSMTVVDIAAVHEFGLGNCPERSFIRSYFDEHGQELADTLLQLMKRVVEKAAATGKPITDGIKRNILTKIGLIAVAGIQEKISSGDIQPPLTEQTIKRKGSSTPLIDTGQLRSSISHEVEL